MMQENTETPQPGTHIVDENADLDPSLLTYELEEENRPTEQHNALEITVLWGDTVVDSATIHKDTSIQVGPRTHKRADLVVEGTLPAESFTVATKQGNQSTIVLPADAKVGLRKADGTVSRQVPLSATDGPFPAKAYQLQMGDRLVFKYGTLTFIAEYVRGNAALGAKGVMDWYFPRVFAISLLLHVFFVVAAFITPQVNRGLVDELFKNQNRFAEMILKAPEEEEKLKKLDLSGKDGSRAKDDEGKFGKKDKPQEDKLASKKGAPRVDAKKREEDRKIAMNSGLLGMLKGGDSAVSNVFGPGGLGTGINNAMGGLQGSSMGDAGGAGGLGTRGTGAGGGGNSLGIGGVGRGTGRGGGGYGNIDLGGRGKGRTRIVPGRTIVKGSLAKEEIARVIRRNLPRFKYCYEKQLNANPNLAGKVSVYFTIAPTGSVANASVSESSMGDATVESCVASVMKSLKFPQPKGGGIVVVTYPFVFSST